MNAVLLTIIQSERGYYLREESREYRGELSSDDLLQNIPMSLGRQIRITQHATRGSNLPRV
jgi:hypothetical protein